MKSKTNILDDWILPLIAAVIAAAALFVPNDMYLVKIIAIVIYTIIIFRHNIKNILLKCNKKKDNESEK